MFAMFRCFGGKSAHQKADNEDKYKMSWRHQKVAPAKQASKTPDSNKKPGTGECDACDGDHPTSKCPHYKKKRGKHPDCKKYTGKRDIGKGTGGNFTLKHARVIHQPADGSCLFHALNYGIKGSSDVALRRKIAQFIRNNADVKVSDNSFKDWIRWSGCGRVASYTRKMRLRGWGGGIEMAAFSLMCKVNVHVYERCRHGQGFKRISCFDSPGASRTVHILYAGRVHYDALVPIK